VVYLRGKASHWPSLVRSYVIQEESTAPMTRNSMLLYGV